MTSESRTASSGVPSTAAASGTLGIRSRLREPIRRASAIAVTEIRIGLRQRWALIVAGIVATFGLLVLTFSGAAPGPSGFDRILASLAMLAVYLVPLLALAYGYSVVVGPAERGWLELLSALPASRSTVLAGLVLGRAAVLSGSLAVGFGIPGAVLVLERGIEYWPPYAAVLLAVTALGLSFLAIAALASTVFREKTHALGAALLAWVWFVIVHDLLGLGLVAAFDLPSWTVSAIVLANPATAYRVLVLDLLSAGESGGFAAVFAAAGLSTELLVAALLVWTVLPVAIGAAVLRHRSASFG